MDQKNTIVKCKAHPNCLFNHNGICDNYVINIGADRECESYIETTFIAENSQWDETFIEEIKRGQRAKCNFYYDNACDVSFLKEDLEKIQQTLEQDSIPCIMQVAESIKTNKNQSIKRAGTLNECWWCDFFNSEKKKCKHKDPDIDRYGCHSSQSTGGNR